MDPFVGEIRAVSFPFAPRGWALCNGQALAINQNQALFALLGVQFGGNGSTTFMLPDLRGRTPVGQGNGSSMGQKAGTDTVTMTVAQLPTHSHQIQANSGTGTAVDPSGQVWASVTDSGGNINLAFTENAPDTTMNPAALTLVGASQPIPVTQPLTVINYIIATTGLFPSRS